RLSVSRPVQIVGDACAHRARAREARTRGGRMSDQRASWRRLRTMLATFGGRVPVRFCLALAAAALVTGCMVGPNYERPSAPTSTAFKESEGWKRAEPRDEAPRGEWWVAFGEPELDALIQEVDVSNQTIQAAEAQVRFARAAIQAARAGLFPVVT